MTKEPIKYHEITLPNIGRISAPITMSAEDILRELEQADEAPSAEGHEAPDELT